MNTNLTRAVVSLGVFVMVCVVAAFGLIAVFANLRFSDQRHYYALFSDVSGLEVNDFVRIAGVEVGQVQKISINDDSTAVVEFTAEPSVVLTEGTKAAIRWANPIGDRYVSLLEGTGGTRPLKPGDTIPLAQTEPALDLDTLLGGFRPLFRALNPDEVNTLSSALIQAFQGEGETIDSFLTQAAQATHTLANRDQLIGEVIGNLTTVLGSLNDQSDQFAKTIDSLSTMVSGLADRRSDITNAVAYTNAAAASIADLMSQAREPFKQTVVQNDRAMAQVLRDHEYFDGVLQTLPEAYRILANLGKRGDFLNEYLCSISVKLNGKGGQPVYVKLISQTSGRCTPK